MIDSGSGEGFVEKLIDHGKAKHERGPGISKTSSPARIG
jgi:hypothetical protein